MQAVSNTTHLCVGGSASKLKKGDSHIPTHILKRNTLIAKSAVGYLNINPAKELYKVKIY